MNLVLPEWADDTYPGAGRQRRGRPTPHRVRQVPHRYANGLKKLPFARAKAGSGWVNRSNAPSGNCVLPNQGPAPDANRRVAGPDNFCAGNVFRGLKPTVSTSLAYF